MFRFLVVLICLILTFGASSCGSSSGNKATVATEKSAAEAGATPADATPQSSAQAALHMLLDAESHGDHEASYRLLSSSGHTTYADASDWGRSRDNLPAITSFVVQSDGPNTQAHAEVHHDPGLDPVSGLAFATEQQIWSAVHVDHGWLLDATPKIQPQYPPDSSAAIVVQAWVQAVQKCDKKASEALQAISPIYGQSQSAGQLCGHSGSVALGTTRNASAGPETQELVSQYGSDALLWARTVPLTSPVTFSVVVAPIGENWRVIGMSE